MCLRITAVPSCLPGGRPRYTVARVVEASRSCFTLMIVFRSYSSFRAKSRKLSSSKILGHVIGSKNGTALNATETRRAHSGLVRCSSPPRYSKGIVAANQWRIPTDTRKPVRKSRTKPRTKRGEVAHDAIHPEQRQEPAHGNLRTYKPPTPKSRKKANRARQDNASSFSCSGGSES